VKEIILVTFVEALAVELVVAMDNVVVLMDGVVQLATVLQTKVDVLIQVL